MRTDRPPVTRPRTVKKPQARTTGPIYPCEVRSLATGDLLRTIAPEQQATPPQNDARLGLTPTSTDRATRIRKPKPEPIPPAELDAGMLARAARRAARTRDQQAAATIAALRESMLGVRQADARPRVTDTRPGALRRMRAAGAPAAPTLTRMPTPAARAAARAAAPATPRLAGDDLTALQSWLMRREEGEMGISAGTVEK